MKTKIVLVLLLGILATTGSTCINDGFLVAVNLPIQTCIAVNSGPNLVFSGSQQVKLADQIDVSYVNNIKSARFYDIQVSTRGTYNGTVYVAVTIDGVSLLKTKSTPWPWSDFATPQSLLGKSEKIAIDSLGLNEVLTKLNQFKTDPSVVVTIAASGTLAGQNPVPSGLSVCVNIMAQVDAQVQ
jgi:hypothetical protein